MVHADREDDRRLTAKGRATRDRIVQVAAGLILSDGLSALNMDTLRKAASVSGSQLAHYFTDKRALIRAVVARQTNVVLDFHRQPMLGALDTFDDFERWIDLNMRYLKLIGYDGTPTYHALTAQLAKSDPDNAGWQRDKVVRRSPMRPLAARAPSRKSRRSGSSSTNRRASAFRSPTRRTGRASDSGASKASLASATAKNITRS